MIKAEIGGFFNYSKKWRLIGSLVLLLASISILSDVFLKHGLYSLESWDYYMIVLGLGNLFLSIIGIVRVFKSPFIAIDNNLLFLKPSVISKVKKFNINDVEFSNNLKTSLSIRVNSNSFNLSYGLFDYKNMQKIRKIEDYIREQKSFDLASKDFKYEQ